MASVTKIDPARLPEPTHSVGVEVVLLTFDERVLRVALVDGALPSETLGAQEALDVAAHRTLHDLVGIDAPVRQFRAFDASEDGRHTRPISIAYAALRPVETLRPLVGEHVRLEPVRDGIVRADDGSVLMLPFGQDEVLAAAIGDLRAHLDTTTWAFGMLADEFTVSALQRLHEAITGRELNRTAFRRRIVNAGLLDPTGRYVEGMKNRPAELYRLKPEHSSDR